MSGRAERAAAWVYEGLWGVLAQWFRVPKEPPTLPVGAGEEVMSFRPAAGFLSYLKLWFWILCLLIDVGIFIIWVVIFVKSALAGVLLALPALFIAVVPDIFSFVAIHLRYDTTWYVMTGRSLRIRRGVWVIHETTITFENVQNVKVHSGPVQRYFGIANLVVETAGAGGGEGHGKGGAVANRGIIEGVANAPDLRDRIMQRLRQSKTAGLGDEDDHDLRAGAAWTRDHLQALREIREETAALRKADAA
ncbi:MAG: PH domain-containing protein [Phycisphaerales bacterium]|nr:MAG: PH domain-containing protein [Phycisphaerales bacterium]